jgi:hypothetical protein
MTALEEFEQAVRAAQAECSKCDLIKEYIKNAYGGTTEVADTEVQKLEEIVSNMRAELELALHDRYRTALERIATCQSYAPGDVVAIARAALCPGSLAEDYPQKTAAIPTVISATIVRNTGSDKVYLETDLPDGCWPYSERLSLKFECAARSAEDYLAKHFPGVPFKIHEG